jgi:pimeloyl-ACP methyl ester carboxylesterase
MAERCASASAAVARFDHLAEIVSHFAEAHGLSRYTLYMQDYGGTVGFRMVLAHPERICRTLKFTFSTAVTSYWKLRKTEMERRLRSSPPAISIVTCACHTPACMRCFQTSRGACGHANRLDLPSASRRE